MKISECIEILTSIKKEFGDVEAQHSLISMKNANIKRLYKTIGS